MRLAVRAVFITALLVCAPTTASAWTTPVDLSGPGAAASVQAAVDARGDALVTWVHDTGASRTVRARWRSKDGTLGPLLAVSDRGQAPVLPQPVVAANGAAVVMWTTASGPRLDGVSVHARRISHAGATGAVMTGCRPARGGGSCARRARCQR
jgi:hypothetical protein